jgi:hypothetical protein
VFPLLVLMLIRLNREYRAEAAILERFRTDRPDAVKFSRHRVFVLVNSVDLAVLEALRYGRGLRADELTAVHFMLDAARAKALRERWDYYLLDTPLRIIDCPDRRLIRGVQDLVTTALSEYPNTNVTVILPRRGYAPVLGRILHDRSADKIARAVSRVPDAAATIVPYDVQSRIREAFPEMFEERLTRTIEQLRERVVSDDEKRIAEHEHPKSDAVSVAINGLIAGRRATVEGRVNEVDDSIRDGKPTRIVVLGDDTGELKVIFDPIDRADDIQAGQLIRVTGKARQSGTRPVSMTNPDYSILRTSTGRAPSE